MYLLRNSNEVFHRTEDITILLFFIGPVTEYRYGKASPVMEYRHGSTIPVTISTVGHTFVQFYTVW